MRAKSLITIFSIAILSLCSTAWAGPIFLTGHDPDFHAQGSTGAANLLKSGIAFVTGGLTQVAAFSPPVRASFCG